MNTVRVEAGGGPLRFSYVDMPYSTQYPPAYMVITDSTKSFTVKRIGDDGEWRNWISLAPATGIWMAWTSLIPSTGEWAATDSEDSVSEDCHVLIEAFRALREQYGDILVFSCPTRSSCFIYRSEYALLLRNWEDRFAWAVHFYQVACGAPPRNELLPERYGGLVFVRPWDVHCGTAGQESPEKESRARRHEGVSPAVCEGYLRLRISQELSPSVTQIARNYADPYGVAGFDSIAFFSPQIGRSCGYIALAAALTIVNRACQYSPYELAAIHATVGGADGLGLDRKSVTLFDGTSVEMRGNLYLPPIKVPDIVRHLRSPDVKVLLERFGNVPAPIVQGDIGAMLDDFKNHDKKHLDWDWKGFWNDFTALLDSYIFLGLPILFSVDVAKLYMDNTDDQLFSDAENGARTDISNCHLVLIHSCLRGSDRPDADKSRRVYVLSDTRDLHATGSVFHKITAKRLWSSAARPKATKAEVENDTQLFAVCAPPDFDLCWQDLRPLFSDCELHLRDRSQLRGFLINRVFSDEFLGSSAATGLSEQIRIFRETLRMYNTSRYVWFVERRQKDTEQLDGLIIDTRCPDKGDPMPLRLWGLYTSNIVKKRLDVWGFQNCDIARPKFRHIVIKPNAGAPPFTTFLDVEFNAEKIRQKAKNILPESAKEHVEFLLKP